MTASREQSRLPAPEDRERLAGIAERLSENYLIRDPMRQSLREIATALRLAAPATGAGAWMPIDTAPLNDLVLLTNGRYVDCGRVGQLFSNTRSGHPTHWMHLPVPPIPAPPSIPDTESKP